jgi:hypothetical protein
MRECIACLCNFHSVGVWVCELQCCCVSRLQKSNNRNQSKRSRVSKKKRNTKSSSNKTDLPVQLRVSAIAAEKKSQKRRGKKQIARYQDHVKGSTKRLKEG